MRFPKVSPEVDTIRLWFDVDGYIKLDDFFNGECQRSIAAFQVELDNDGLPLRDKKGKPIFSCVWEKQRADSMCSWWCKMQITIAHMQVKKNESRKVLQVEYSVAKWHNITNGVNRGVRPSRVDIIRPIFTVLENMHIGVYTRYGDIWQKILLDHCQIRRLDMSYNFKTDDVKRVLAELSVCRLNNKSGNPIVKDFNTETINFGGTRGSLYKAMFYDKEEEQKRYFSLIGVDNTLDTQENKRIFYSKYKDLFKNVLRFEVQYHSKFFVCHFGKDYKDKKDMNMFNKIIDLCQINYGDILRKFDEQLGMINVRPEDEYSLYNQCMNRIESIRLSGGISDTQSANLKQFVEDCFKRSWMAVRSSMSQQLFSVKYRKVKTLTKMDLKAICITQLPIMRIMESESYSMNWQRNYKILPSHIMNFAV